MQVFLQDLRYAFRQLRKAPGFTVTAVITLALGIGANTAIFTLVQGILLRSLPVADPSRLYRIGDTDDCCIDGGFQNQTGDYAIFSYDAFRELRSNAPEFEQLAAVQAGQNTYNMRRGETEPRKLRFEYVTGNYFTSLGVNAYMGRSLIAADDAEGAPPVVELSYAAWQSDFGGDPTIIGSTLFIQTRPFIVAGVAPPAFFGDRVSVDPPAVWIPLNNEPLIEGPNSILHNADSNWLYPIGRLRPNVNIPALDEKLSGILRQFLKTRPVYAEYGAVGEIAKQHVVIVPAGGGVQNMQIETGKGLRILMILSSVVLLIACANIANLLLARSMARRSAIAVRMALGASRMRVTRQMITESVLLACLGGLAGLAVAYGGSHTILALAFPDARNLPISSSPSLPVLAFAFGVSLVTGLLFGFAPAWLASHAQPAEVLRGTTRTTHDGSTLPQKALVVFQAGLSIVLIAGAILLTRSLNNLENQKFGIQTSNRYVFHIDPAGAGYTVDQLLPLYHEIEDRFSAIPGVANVALSMYNPLSGDNWSDSIFVPGHPLPQFGGGSWATWDRVTPGFLDSIGVPVLRGRGITRDDTAATPFVAVVNESFVKKFFPNEDPLGKHFGVDGAQYANSFEIIGIIPDFKMNDPRNPPRRLYLRPFTQRFTAYQGQESIGETRSMFLRAVILHFKTPQQNVDELVRRTLQSINPNMIATDLRPYDAQVADNFTQDRLMARLTTLFGLLALALASVGLYGVMSYLVVRRTGEIGIRMALGATRSKVLTSVLQGALWQILLGFAIGVPTAMLASHYMQSELYGVNAFDPLAFLGAVLVLSICAAIAGFLPARRAASIEPMQALRNE